MKLCDVKNRKMVIEKIIGLPFAKKNQINTGLHNFLTKNGPIHFLISVKIKSN
jgi:hypothetical protein